MIGALDFLRALSKMANHLPSGSTLAEAFGFALAIHALPCAMIGAAFGFVVALGGRAPRSTAALRSVAFPRMWLRPSPSLFTGAVLGASAVSAGVILVHEVAWQITSTFHDVALTTWAIAISSTLIVLMLAVVLRSATRPLDRVALRLGLVASPLAIALVACVAVLVLYRWLGARYAPVLRAFDTFTTIVFSTSPVGFAIFAIRLARRDRRVAFVPWLAVATLAFGGAAVAYGRQQSVRSVLEDHGPISSLTLALLQRTFDFDGDGHAHFFGGRDCNDADANVGPGQTDVRGDGIDRDCFGGDGTPRFDDTRPFESASTAAGPRPNVVLITVDALRGDRLRNTSRGRSLTPHIDAFLDEAIHFTSVTAASPRTIRSVPAMMTGRYPGEIAFSANFTWPGLLDSNETLAELLSATHRTIAVMGTSYFDRSEGFFQGFEVAQSASSLKPRRGETLSRALGYITTPPPARPVFLWVHLFNVHEPYLHDGRPSLYGPGFVSAYDTEVTLADEEVGAILAQLDRAGWANNTVVLLASDHGEAFGDHNNLRGHSTRVFEDQIASVLAIRAPGFRPNRIETPVALFDVFPTVLDLTGQTYEGRLSSRTLVRPMRGDLSGVRDRFVFSEVFPDSVFGMEYLSIRRGRDKLIFEPRGGRFSLFDLDRDPREQRNTADENPATARSMLWSLRSWEASTRRTENRTAALIDAARIRTLPPRLSHRFDHTFGDVIQLLGANFESLEVTPDGYLEFDFFFRKTRWTNTDFVIAVRFTSERGAPIHGDFHAIHAPVDGHYPTSNWRTNEIVRDHVRVRVPRDIASESQFLVNLEIWDTNRRSTPYVSGTTVARTLEIARITVN